MKILGFNFEFRSIDPNFGRNDPFKLHLYNRALSWFKILLTALQRFDNQTRRLSYEQRMRDKKTEFYEPKEEKQANEAGEKFSLVDKETP